MLVAGFPAAMFGTNCYVVATGPGQECVVVDPGIDVVDQLDQLLAEHHLQPVAVALTHGHLDHTFSVTPVCGARGIPAYIHSADRDRLADPMATLGPQLTEMFAGRLTWTEPDDVRELVDHTVLNLAGLDITIEHAPGHTQGSVLLSLPARGDVPPLCLSGDVLFAGSIGRTDLIGGDFAAMQQSLRTKILPLADDTVVLPGHGPQTTIGQERATNPYLRELSQPAPSRGM